MKLKSFLSFALALIVAVFASSFAFAKANPSISNPTQNFTHVKKASAPAAAKTDLKDFVSVNTDSFNKNLAAQASASPQPGTVQSINSNRNIKTDDINYSPPNLSNLNLQSKTPDKIPDKNSIGDVRRKIFVKLE
ncbi:MAG: hypothetical protein ACR2GD_11650 [Pyrinomonadaceae bacterium]